MIPNLVTVENCPDSPIWRGGQPDVLDILHMKSLGVKRIIKLNSDEDGSDDSCTAIGIELYKCPISLIQQILTEPDLQYIRDVIGFISPGTFIHCEHGQDRTGLVVGLYRVWMCGWPKQQAYEEMLSNGFHTALLGLLKAWDDLT